ncbi:hypothetical protein QFC22_000516 [Naganishia vaughanmartiniae]|uniref:Uncharacterized protein n=1 Tax=Naganishia vaughanmartiniae TaxID=1424756 RepID=A0ACC2XQ31_9TREE|nr:hypothetical protein QFC22_000516 [Naganishia vaughanmartiniae]
MSGKPKPKETNAFPQGKRNQDLLQRLNHLYQANTYLASVSHELAGGVSPAPVGCEANETPLSRNKARKARRRESREKADALAVVARRSNQRFKVMVKHNILHTDPSLKRSFCKGCNAICIPGLNARVRVRSSTVHGNKLITTCSTCSTTRTIPAPPTQPKTDLPAVSMCPSQLDVIAQEEQGPSAVVDRITKRRKLVRKMPFWRKEAPAPTDSVQEVNEAVHVDPRGKPVLLDSRPKESTTINNINPDLPNVEAISTASHNNATTSPSHPVERFDVHASAEAVFGTPSTIPPTAPSTSQVAKAPKQKQTKAQKQKGKSAADGDILEKQDGHHIWRGEVLVTGWGDLVEPRHPASSA